MDQAKGWPKACGHGALGGKMDLNRLEKNRRFTPQIKARAVLASRKKTTAMPAKKSQPKAVRLIRTRAPELPAHAGA